jgi:hypothetical protein
MKYFTSQDSTIFFSTEDEFWWFHGVLFWICWGVFGLVTIISALYLKEHWKYRIYIHSIAGGLIVALTLIVRGFSISIFGWGVMPGFHSIIGFLTLVTVFLSLIVGVILRLLQNRLNWSGHIIDILKKMHQMSSWFIFIIAQISIVSGFIKYE